MLPHPVRGVRKRHVALRIPEGKRPAAPGWPNARWLTPKRWSGSGRAKRAAEAVGFEHEVAPPCVGGGGPAQLLENVLAEADPSGRRMEIGARDVPDLADPAGGGELNRRYSARSRSAGSPSAASRKSGR